jgi:hypothetical protein
MTTPSRTMTRPMTPALGPAYDAMCDRLRSAWRKPLKGTTAPFKARDAAPGEANPNAAPSIEGRRERELGSAGRVTEADVEARRSAQYADFCARLENAWR